MPLPRDRPPTMFSITTLLEVLCLYRLLDHSRCMIISSGTSRTTLRLQYTKRRCRCPLTLRVMRDLSNQPLWLARKLPNYHLHRRTLLLIGRATDMVLLWQRKEPKRQRTQLSSSSHRPCSLQSRQRRQQCSPMGMPPLRIRPIDRVSQPQPPLTRRVRLSPLRRSVWHR